MLSSSSHYFLAVPLPDSIKRILSSWQRDLKEALPYKQWTHQKDFHITLKFLGGLSNEELNELIQVMAEINQLSLFEIDIAGLHTFGSPSRPRVLWAGVRKSESLMRLQKKTEKLCNKIGFKPEGRSYQPHITIGKKWNGQEDAKAVRQWIHAFQDQFMHFYADRIVLYRIEPERTPKYQIQEIFSLSGRQDHGSTD